MKQKLSEMVVVVHWLRMQVLGMEAPGSNSGKFFCFFPTFFAHLFYPMMIALLEYLDPAILHVLGFCFITLLL